MPLLFDRKLSAIGLLGFVLAVAGCHSEQAVSLSPEKAADVRVKTVSAITTDVDKKTFQPATVLAYYETEIRCKVSGFVAELNVDMGDFVKKGDPLAVLDIPELRKKRLTLEAQIELLVAQEEGAASGVDLAEASVQSAKAQLEQAKSELGSVQASLAAAEAEFDRTSDLVQRGSLQNRILDEVRKKRDSATAGLGAIKSAVVSAEAEVAVAVASKAAAAAKLRSAEAETKVGRGELDELLVLIEYAILKAPFDGVITERNVNLGDLVDGQLNAGSDPLFVLSQIDKVRIHIPVPEMDAPFVQRGDSVNIRFPSFASEPALAASVSRIAESLDPKTRTMIVEAEVENTDGKWLPGMFGEASIDLETKVAVNMLPSRAVRFDESGQAYVYLVSEDNTVQVTTVTTGLDTGNEIEILTGMVAGQRVIDGHLKRFTDGQRVDPL